MIQYTVPQQSLDIEYTLTAIDNNHINSNFIYSIDPVVTDSNSLTFTVSGKDSSARLDVDSNACNDVVTDESKYGWILVMKRLALLDVVFTNDDGVRILIDNQHVHTL